MIRTRRAVWTSLAIIGACVAGPSATHAQEAWLSLPGGEVGPGGLAPCFRCGMAYDSARGVIVRFSPGGADGSGPGETREWNGVTWLLRSDTGPSRRECQIAYDSDRGVCVLYGGTSSVAELSDTWEWDGTSWIERETTGTPGLRGSPALAFDPVRGVTVMFGGNFDSNTWTWDGQSWTLAATTGPAPRHVGAMAFDAARSVVVLFGGRVNNTTASSDTWEWNGAVWTQRFPATSPASRDQHPMAYDPACGRVILSGGNPGFLTDTWAWDGSAWTQIPAVFPSAPWSFVTGRMVYFARDGYLLAAGRTNTAFKFQALPSLPHGPANTQTCPGGMANFAITIDYGGQPFAYQWYRNDQALTDGSTDSGSVISGSSTGALTISNASAAGDAAGLAYYCTVSNSCGTIYSHSAYLAVCPADSNCDGVIDLTDLATLLTHFGTPSGATLAQGDIDGDGAVGLTDLALLLTQYGGSCN